MEMESALKANLLLLLSHKFAEMDTLQIQMVIAFIQKIHLHQLFILAPLDSKQMEMEVAFKKELLLFFQLMKYAKTDTQVTVMEIVFLLIQKNHFLPHNKLANLDMSLMETEDAC
jgi:hypothetical protein